MVFLGFFLCFSLPGRLFSGWPSSVQALLDSSGDVLMEIIVVEDGTVPAIQRPDLTGATVTTFANWKMAMEIVDFPRKHDKND